ncbi:hypothetical protein GR167_03060 [Rhodobacteraceae bacterium GS-10]|uniref:Uncharacterized protein n=1 Tax=Thalassovita mangrovi TaxID=2692236 RepID=A0A6L8LIJ0_9RHOB|nr:hypothetical protein [Thalassovita mangrovi]
MTKSGIVGAGVVLLVVGIFLIAGGTKSIKQNIELNRVTSCTALQLALSQSDATVEKKLGVYCDDILSR